VGGTRSGTRTRTPLREGAFKAPASTGFAIRATENAKGAAPARSLVQPHRLIVQLVRPYPIVVQQRAGNGTRTRDPNLGKVVLYQLSYSRMGAT